MHRLLAGEVNHQMLPCHVGELRGVELHQRVGSLRVQHHGMDLYRRHRAHVERVREGRGDSKSAKKLKAGRAQGVNLRPSVRKSAEAPREEDRVDRLGGNHAERRLAVLWHGEERVGYTIVEFVAHGRFLNVAAILSYIL